MMMNIRQLNSCCNPTTVSTSTTLTTDVKVEGRNASDITISHSQELEVAANTTQSSHSFISASLASDSEILTQTDVGSGIDVSEFDVGRYVRSTTTLSDDLKHRLLTNPY